MRPTMRWLVPIAVTATILGGTAFSSAMAGSTPTLPGRTPEQVLAAAAGSQVTALSGTVATHADLGMPALPSSMGGAHGGGSTNSPQALLTRFLAGDNTIRVWADGPQRQRAQLIDPWADLDVVRNGSQLWTYDSTTNTVQHGTIPSTAPKTTPGPAASGAPTPSGSTAGQGGAAVDPRTMTPDQLARRMLAQLSPTTTVSLDPPATVAGRDSYLLRLTPRTGATLVDHVQIAVEARTGVPLQVTVFARGQANPALRTGFTSVNFAKPAAERFTFTPPKSATVTPLPTPDQLKHPGGSADQPGSGTAAKPTVIGTGWAAIVELPAGTGASAKPGTTQPGTTQPGAGKSPATTDLLNQLTTPVAGGRALRTALVNVLLTADGRVLAGAVPLSALQAAAARG